MNRPEESLREIRITTTAQVEDAVSELLVKILGGSTSIHADWETGETHVTAFLPMKKAWTRALRRKITDGLAWMETCGLQTGAAKLRVRRIRKADWAEAWKRHFPPIEVGHALLIKPSWVKRPPRRGQSLIVLDPGLSFGTGQHATTSFCLHRLAACRIQGRSQAFLDIGTGSGILAIAAAKLGYRPVAAFDVDPESIRVARSNVIQNGVFETVKPARKNLATLPLDGGRRYDVVCANLICDLLIAQAERVASRVKPDGHLVLAGILASQFRRIVRTYRKLGFRLMASRIENEWQSGLFLRGPDPSLNKP